MVVPIQFSLPSGEVVVRVDDLNQLPMAPGVSSGCKELNSELVKGVDVTLEEWVSDICPEDAFQFTNSSPPLNVKPLAFSLPMGVMDIPEGSATLDEEKLLGKDIYSEWFQEKFSGFDDFLGTSLKGLEEPATKFLLVVEAELQQRAIKEQTDKAVKSSMRKGIRELRGLFSSVNYGSISSRHIGNGKDRALISFQ